MAHYTGKRTSPRHGFVFHEVPTVKASIYGGSITKHYADSYGPMLDSVYEMADDLMSANGIGPAAAVAQACADEGWRLLPKHKNMIVARLTNG